MKKFIHIRGATGSGKSTAVCQYLLKTDGFVLYKILIGHKSYPYYYNKSKKVLVTGVYGNKTCGGCDGVINSKEIMIKYLNLLELRRQNFDKKYLGEFSGWQGVRRDMKKSYLKTGLIL